jgi:hypothetical protein
MLHASSSLRVIHLVTHKSEYKYLIILHGQGEGICCPLNLSFCSLDRGGAFFFRKEAGLFCGSLLRKDEVFAYVGSIQNLKDLKDHLDR